MDLLLDAWVTGIWISSTIYTFLFSLGILRFMKRRRSNKIGTGSPDNFIIQITTKGSAADSVLRIVRQLRGYNLPFPYQIWVVGEEYDHFPYPVDRILRVPASYKTPHGTRFKARALCYAREVRMNEGVENYGTKLLLLDDDTVPTRGYITYAYRCSYEVAQGVLSARRDYGKNLLASIADSIRTADCLAFCLHFNSAGDARLVHGDGLLVRGNVENEIGWDFGYCLSEDLIFGRRATRRFSFGFIPDYVEIAPAKNLKDFFFQRRRWIWGTLMALRDLDNSERIFILARYFLGGLGVMSAYLAISAQLFNLSFLSLFSIYILMSPYYVLGNWFSLHKLREAAKAFLLMLPASTLDVASLILTFILRPTGYDVIRK